MIISAIVAMTPDRVIGKDNQIPWYLPADLKYFKRTTIGHHIIMGRNCFESIGKPLPKRTNVVLTRDPYYIASGTVMAHSINEALEIAYENGEDEAFIIGGGQIYEQSIEYWDRLYVTWVDLEAEGDVYFPALDWSTWNMISEKKHQPDEKNKWAYRFCVYERAVAPD